MYDFWEMECDRQNILSLWTIFGLLSSLQPRKSKFWKHQNNAWRYYHFTHLYHKWQSYHVWFLKYKAWQTGFFVILDCFLPFYLPNNLKNQNFAKNERNRYYHFTHVYHKCWSFTPPPHPCSLLHMMCAIARAHTSTHATCLMKEKTKTSNAIVDHFSLTSLFLLWFTPCKAEDPLQGKELQEKETQND